MSASYSQASLAILECPLAELELLSKEIRNRIKYLREKSLIDEISKQVSERGYYVSPDFDKDLEGLKKMTLSYKVYVKAHDKEDKSDMYISDSSDKQDDWVQEFGFYDYSPEHHPKDLNRVKIGKDDWQFGDWDDPVFAIGSIPITVYYAVPEVPPTKFTTINKEGKSLNGAIKDGQVNIDGNESFSVDKWKDEMVNYIVIDYSDLESDEEN